MKELVTQYGESYGVNTEGQRCAPPLLLVCGIRMVSDLRGHMLRVKPGLNSAIDGDGAAILDADTGVISTLNSTGAHVWNGLCSGTSLEEIIVNVSAETGESIEVVEPDVRRFVEQLIAEGLVQD